MVDPPEVTLFPAASFPCKVMATLDPEVTVLLAIARVDVAGEIAPGVTVTVGAVVRTELPPIVLLTVVAVPAVTPVKSEV
jgi:hypothetical protein